MVVTQCIVVDVGALFVKLRKKYIGAVYIKKPENNKLYKDLQKKEQQKAIKKQQLQAKEAEKQKKEEQLKAAKEEKKLKKEAKEQKKLAKQKTEKGVSE